MTKNPFLEYCFSTPSMNVLFICVVDTLPQIKLAIRDPRDIFFGRGVSQYTLNRCEAFRDALSYT